MSRYGRAFALPFSRRLLQRRRPWLVLTTDFRLVVSRQKFTVTTGRRLLISTFFSLCYILHLFPISLSLSLVPFYSPVLSRDPLLLASFSPLFVPFFALYHPYFLTLSVSSPVSLSVFCRGGGSPGDRASLASDSDSYANCEENHGEGRFAAGACVDVHRYALADTRGQRNRIFSWHVMRLAVLSAVLIGATPRSRATRRSESVLNQSRSRIHSIVTVMIVKNSRNFTLPLRAF